MRDITQFAREFLDGTLIALGGGGHWNNCRPIGLHQRLFPGASSVDGCGAPGGAAPPRQGVVVVVVVVVVGGSGGGPTCPVIVAGPRMQLRSCKNGHVHIRCCVDSDRVNVRHGVAGVCCVRWGNRCGQGSGRVAGTHAGQGTGGHRAPTGAHSFNHELPRTHHQELQQSAALLGQGQMQRLGHSSGGGVDTDGGMAATLSCGTPRRSVVSASRVLPNGSHPKLAD